MCDFYYLPLRVDHRSQGFSVIDLSARIIPDHNDKNKMHNLLKHIFYLLWKAKPLYPIGKDAPSVTSSPSDAKDYWQRSCLGGCLAKNFLAITTMAEQYLGISRYYNIITAVMPLFKNFDFCSKLNNYMTHARKRHSKHKTLLPVPYTGCRVDIKSLQFRRRFWEGDMSS